MGHKSELVRDLYIVQPPSRFHCRNTETQKSHCHTVEWVKQTQHYAETRDPPSQDPRDHIEQAIKAWQLKKAILKHWFDVLPTRLLVVCVLVFCLPTCIFVDRFVLHRGPAWNADSHIQRLRSRVVYSSAKKRRHILETHWLALSMLIVILARGHGSGKVERQWSNSDVTLLRPFLGRFIVVRFLWCVVHVPSRHRILPVVGDHVG